MSKLNFLAGLLCILGIILEVLNYIIKSAIRLLPLITPEKYISLVDDGTSVISTGCFYIFLVLFFVCLWTDRVPAFLQKIIDNYPRTAVYLCHFGLFFYIFIIFYGCLFAWTQFASADIIAPEYIYLALIIMGTGCLIIPLISATYAVFIRRKHEKTAQ